MPPRRRLQVAVVVAGIVLGPMGCVSDQVIDHGRRQVHRHRADAGRHDADGGGPEDGGASLDAAPVADATDAAANDAGRDAADAASTLVCDPDASYEQMPRPNAGMSEAPGDPGCPSGMARVTDFCVDRYEAALVEVLADGSERSWSPYFNPAGRRVRAVSIAGAVPQGYITGEQAADACAEAGKRLCTNAEWLRACQGPDAQTFPYGDTRRAGVCNDARDRHPVIDYFETSADWIWSELGNACIGQQPDTVAPAGAHDECVSAEGTYDMMGNLHEWTADPNGTFRGGFYADTERNGPGCLYATTAHNRQHWDYSTGFRCCADVRP